MHLGRNTLNFHILLMWKVVSRSLSFCPAVEISWPAERTDRRQREATYLMKTVILWCPDNPNPPPPRTSNSVSHADTWGAESLRRHLYVDESLSETVPHTGNIFSPAWVGNLRSGTRGGTSRHSSSTIWCSTVSPHIMNCRKIWLHSLITTPQLVWWSHRSMQLPFLE